MRLVDSLMPPQHGSLLWVLLLGIGLVLLMGFLQDL